MASTSDYFCSVLNVGFSAGYGSQMNVGSACLPVGVKKLIVLTGFIF